MKFIISFIILCNINYLFSQNSNIQDPIKNFDYLWNTFNDRYAFFELKNINWDQVYKKYRPLITNKTTNDSLFSVCNQMLLKLKDGHVNLAEFNDQKKIIRLSDDGHENILIKKFPKEKTAQPNLQQLLDLTHTTVNKQGLTKERQSKSGNLQYSYSNEYAYLSIKQMYRFKFLEIKKFFNSIADNLKDKKGIIIDIRTNPGGHDRISLKIAGYFANKKQVAFYKKERIKGTQSYKKLKTKFVKPKGKNQFTNPIVLLTSDRSASAADIFALTMKKLPHVTIIGDNTQGIFSDMYSFKLPNKWMATLSHQQYFSADMMNYEGIGIAPHIKMLNEPEDITNGKDPLIIKALEVLADGKSNH